MSERVPPIRSELLAAKIEKLLNFELPELFDEFTEEPRFIRALWFLEHVSKPDNYPGGLTRFAEDFSESCRDQIGTAAMVAADANSPRYKIEDAIAVFNALPGRHREAIFGDDTWIFENACHEDNVSNSGPVTFERVIENWDGLSFIGNGPCRGEDELQTWAGAMSELWQRLIEKVTPTIARDLCMSDARDSLAKYFKELCELPHIGLKPNENHFGAPRYFVALGPALLDFIERRADAARAAIADTEVTRLVLRWMTKARAMGEPVMISGNSRFGKTEAVTRNTAPARLNWVRRAVLDRELAAVFVCTPQSYLPAKKRFIKTTGFAMEQFDERILKIVHLPNELSESDLLAVARIHFKDMSDDYLLLVVKAALATERNYVSDISKIAALAKDNARELGRERPLLDDIEAAIADVLPTPPLRTAGRPEKPALATPLQPLRKPQACTLQTSRISPADLKESHRGMQPLAVKA